MASFICLTGSSGSDEQNFESCTRVLTLSVMSPFLLLVYTPCASQLPNPHKIRFSKVKPKLCYAGGPPSVKSYFMVLALSQPNSHYYKFLGYHFTYYCSSMTAMAVVPEPGYSKARRPCPSKSILGAGGGPSACLDTSASMRCARPAVLLVLYYTLCVGGFLKRASLEGVPLLLK